MFPYRLLGSALSAVLLAGCSSDAASQPSPTSPSASESSPIEPQSAKSEVPTGIYQLALVNGKPLPYAHGDTGVSFQSERLIVSEEKSTYGSDLVVQMPNGETKEVLTMGEFSTNDGKLTFVSGNTGKVVPAEFIDGDLVLHVTTKDGTKLTNTYKRDISQTGPPPQ